MKLRSYQKDFFKYWGKFCDVGIMLWDRQAGKTQSSIQELCRLASNNDSYEISAFFHGPALAFARDEFLRKFEDIGKTHLIKQQSAKVIRLTNNSVIRLHNLREEESLRGNVVHTIYVDEFGFMTNRVFEHLILYKMAVPNVKIIMSSSTDTKEPLTKKIQYLQDQIGYKNYFIHDYIN